MPLELTLETRLIRGDEVIRSSEKYSAGKLQSVDEPIAAASSASIALPIDVSALKLIYITCDQPVSLEFEGPAVSMSLAAGAVFLWAVGAIPVPFSEDVTGIAVVNESEDRTANLEIAVLSDPTP